MIIGCENTAHRIRHTHTLRELDLIRVRGRRGTLTVHQVLGASDAARDTMARVCALYAVGRQHLFETRWSDAARAFGAARALDPDDRPSAIMLERAEALANAPPTDWDNVWPPRHLA